jgi:hypothetical protein
VNPAGCHPRQGDQQAAQQPGKGDTRPADLHADDEGEGRQQNQLERREHPFAGAQVVAGEHAGVQGGAAGRDRRRRPHRRGGPPPGRQQQRGARAADGEPPPPRAALDAGQLAEHRLAPLFPLRGQQAGGPPQEPGGRVFIQRLIGRDTDAGAPERHDPHAEQADQGQQERHLRLT